jgi:hypothetical protein
MKVSQVKRRIKRRSERKSRQNNKANLVRSRKQRARKTARKMMRGGAEETINIGIQQVGDANVVDDAVSLKFSDKNKLVMSIDIDKYKGDVRKLLDLLFHIDGFNPIKTHNQTFLMGLADYPGRERTKQAALEYVRFCRDVYNEAKTNVQELIDKTFSTVNVCDLEIELKEVNGNITCIVKKYHRMKIGETSCVYHMHKIDKYGPRTVESNPVDLYYPRLEFADSNPRFMGIGGVDYMDSNTGDVYRKQQNNLFTFTVKGKTIENLKSELNNLNSIMVINDEDPTTAAIEEQKTKKAAEAEEQKTKEAAEAEEQKTKEAAAAEEARKKKAETEFDEVYVKNDVKDNLKEAIKVISPFIEWIKDWRQKNNYNEWVIDWREKNYYKKKEEGEFVKKREEINKEFESKYKQEERDKITESLKICRQEYQKLNTNNRKIFHEYFNSMNYGKHRYPSFGLGQFDEYLELKDKDAVNEIIALWNKVFYMPYDYD